MSMEQNKDQNKEVVGRYAELIGGLKEAIDGNVMILHDDAGAKDQGEPAVSDKEEAAELSYDGEASPASSRSDTECQKEEDFNDDAVNGDVENVTEEEAPEGEAADAENDLSSEDDPVPDKGSCGGKDKPEKSESGVPSYIANMFVIACLGFVILSCCLGVKVRRLEHLNKQYQERIEAHLNNEIRLRQRLRDQAVAIGEDEIKMQNLQQSFESLQTEYAAAVGNNEELLRENEALLDNVRNIADEVNAMLSEFEATTTE